MDLLVIMAEAVGEATDIRAIAVANLVILQMLVLIIRC